MKISNNYGYCHYCLCHDCAKLHNLYVEKEHRRQGHATTLIQKAIDEIRASGYAGGIKIVAEPQEDITKEELIKFYKRMNLKVVTD